MTVFFCGRHKYTARPDRPVSVRNRSRSVMTPLLCSSFSYLFLGLCSLRAATSVDVNKPDALHGRFETIFQWTHLNYTWQSREQYSQYVSTRKYIPENNVFTGIKIYNERIYLSMPRFKVGVPATLGYIDLYSKTAFNQPIVPFPNWSANDDSNCYNLQSVQSMEIDTRGIMWVLDGIRINNYNRCPAKLLLLDLKQDRLVRSFIFPQEICLQDGGFLNDIVIDDSDGGFAYITDNSAIDPGLIVYSLHQNRAWKLRDASMFPARDISGLVIDDRRISVVGPIDGIALSPKTINGEDRTLFYCSLTALNLYSISTSILKNEELVKMGNWRAKVKTVGKKRGTSDGLIVDNAGNLFFTLPTEYGIGKWNINTSFSTSRIIDKNRREMIWPDTFAMDRHGYLYVNANKVYNYIIPNNTLYLTNDVKFRIFKLYTGTGSYLYYPPNVLN